MLESIHHLETSMVFFLRYWRKTARTFGTTGNKNAKNEGVTTLLNKLSSQPSCVKFFYRVRRVLRSGCLIAHHTSITRWRIGNEQTYFQFSVPSSLFSYSLRTLPQYALVSSAIYLAAMPFCLRLLGWCLITGFLLEKLVQR